MNNFPNYNLKEFNAYVQNFNQDISDMISIKNTIQSWIKRGIDLNLGTDQLQNQINKWIKKENELIEEFKNNINELKKVDDRIEKNDIIIYNDNLDSFSEKWNELFTIYEKIYCNLEEDVKILNNAKNDISAYEKLGVQMGNAMQLLDSQINNIKASCDESLNKLKLIIEKIQTESKKILTEDEMKKFNDVTEGLLVDFNASDYNKNIPNEWQPRVGKNKAVINSGVLFDENETAFKFSKGSECILYNFKSNPNALKCATYELWVKLDGNPENLAWVLSQYPDYGWSRSIVLNDHRLGNCGITQGHGHNFNLGKPPINKWHHLVGVWDQGGTSNVYLNGKAGNPRTNTKNGVTKNNNSEQLVIGGRGKKDHRHNSKCFISDVRIYNRILTHDEIIQLFNKGRRS